MASSISLSSYQELILFLAVAGVVVPLFLKLRLNPVLGFLGAGALLGPFGLGRFAEGHPWLSWLTIESGEEISHLAEFGVVFLLFTIGIELSFERLRVLRRLVFGLGSLQVVVSTLAIATIAYFLTGDLKAAAFIGVSLALSSTAIVIPVIAAQKRLNAPAGRTSFAVLLFQDLAVAPLLFTISVLGTQTETNILTGFAAALGQAAVALAVLVGFGRLLLRPLFQLVAATRSSELFMAASLLVVLTTGLITAMSGLSMALGAFIAGLLLAETEYRRAIEATIEPFKGLLLGVFFLTVGMGLDISRLIENPVPILVVSIGLILLKGGILLALARGFRLSRPVAIEAAALLSSGGEFAFVILGAAMMSNLMSPDIGRDVLLVTTLTMIAIPGLAKLGRRWGKQLADGKRVAEIGLDAPPADEANHVLIAGYGRVGQLVSDMLERHQVPYLALDANPTRVSAARKNGRNVYFGDCSQPELLRACGIERARGLVITLDTPSAVEAVVRTARSERADITIVARARDAGHATKLYGLGVDDAVPETIEASLQLSEAVLVDIGVPMGLVIASIHQRRDEFRKELKSDNPGLKPSAFRARRTVGKS